MTGPISATNCLDLVEATIGADWSSSSKNKLGSRTQFIMRIRSNCRKTPSQARWKGKYTLQAASHETLERQSRIITTVKPVPHGTAGQFVGH